MAAHAVHATRSPCIQCSCPAPSHTALLGHSALCTLHTRVVRSSCPVRPHDPHAAAVTGGMCRQACAGRHVQAGRCRQLHWMPKFVAPAASKHIQQPCMQRLRKRTPDATDNARCRAHGLVLLPVRLMALMAAVAHSLVSCTPVERLAGAARLRAAHTHYCPCCPCCGSSCCQGRRCGSG